MKRVWVGLAAVLIGSVVAAVTWIAARDHEARPKPQPQLTATSTQAKSGRPPGTAREYTASLAYARCMRAHGVPQPNPAPNGDINLTPADERRMRAIGHSKVQAADKLCFNLHLKGVVSTKPLSLLAMARALEVLRELSACMHSYGYSLGKPVVRNMSRGRAFFGFDKPPRGGPTGKPLARAQRTCEQRVQLARRIDAIVKADRVPH